MLIAPLIMLLVAGVFSLILLPGLAFVGICMGFGWIFGKLVLDPIEYLFTLIFRRRHASA